MKKTYLFTLIIIVLFTFTGCDLIGNLFGFGDENSDEIYFWSVFKDVDETTGVPVRRTLNDPIKIIMTRGGSPEYATEVEAMNAWPETDFQVWFDDSLQPGGPQDAMKQSGGWHLKQVFELTGVQVGETYTVKGNSTVDGDPVENDLPWDFILTIK